MNQFNPDTELDHRERASLALIASEEGYAVLHKIIRSEVDKFVVDLINADGSSPAEVLEKHRICKAAAQLYEGWTRRVQHEVQNYTNEMSTPQKPQDFTAGVLDFGAHVNTDREDYVLNPLEGGVDEY